VLLKKVFLAVAGVFAFSMPVLADHVQIDVPEVDIRAQKETFIDSFSADSGDTANLLSGYSSVDLYQAGGLSALPAIRGLNDDRIKITVDGASITSACGNHMNPPLTYIAPASVGEINVMAGITPVSMGGDSIAGTIEVNSDAPRFAADAEHLLVNGSASSFYRSNNNGVSANIGGSVASQNFSAGFSGGMDRAQSYEDGHGDKVRATMFDRRYQDAVFALKGDIQQLTLRLGHQDILYQGFPNQLMDMEGNQSDSVNARYEHRFDWGKLDARVFWQQVDHVMGFFSSEKPGMMPMITEGEDYGYSVKLDIPMSQAHLLKIGTDYHRQTLEDFWPPVPMSMMMGPNTFVNINNGKRDRFGLYSEVESKWSGAWSSLLGVRVDHVRTDAGDVQSYDPTSMMMAADNAAAAAFNQRDKSKDDTHFDLTATAKYEPGATQSIEFGVARKTRSPSLYERYTWGRGDMAMAMIGWFGDANGYVGDIDLKPEKAHTLSATFDWHDAGGQVWQLQLTPYYTYVQDYIGANRIGTSGMMMGSRPLLQFANRDAELYGAEMVWGTALWDSGTFGQGRLTGNIRYTRGQRVGNNEDLYHIMPLNARFAVEQTKGEWKNIVELELVHQKTQVDDTREEPETAGYGLMNLRSSYQWKHAKLDFAVTNLFDKVYEPPLGGVNYANWNAGGGMGTIGALPGMGRSINVGLTLNY